MQPALIRIETIIYNCLNRWWRNDLGDSKNPSPSMTDTDCREFPLTPECRTHFSSTIFDFFFVYLRNTPTCILRSTSTPLLKSLLPTALLLIAWAFIFKKLKSLNQAKTFPNNDDYVLLLGRSIIRSAVYKLFKCTYIMCMSMKCLESCWNMLNYK